MTLCDHCVETNPMICEICIDNPKFQKILKTLPKLSHFKDYISVCPRGYVDCIHDPAYIKHHYPDWYKELYGDLTPKEAILVESGCKERFENDPDEKYYCYDDEDK